MLLMVKKCIREVIYHSIDMQKAKNKYMQDYDKNKESSYIQYQDVYNLYGWGMSLKLPVNNFGYIKDTSQCKEDFIINYNSEKGDKRYFLEVDVQYTQKLHKFHNGLPFL